MDWEKFPCVATQRLCLRKLVASDGEAFFKGLSEPKVGFGFGEPVDNLEQAAERLLWYREQWYLRAGVWWAICSVNAPALMGLCGLSDLDMAQRSAVISYWLHPDHWRQGYASEAVGAALDYAFHQMDLKYVLAYVRLSNGPSVNLLTRNGFVLHKAFEEWPSDNGSLDDVCRFVYYAKTAVAVAG